MCLFDEISKVKTCLNKDAIKCDALRILRTIDMF